MTWEDLQRTLLGIAASAIVVAAGRWFGVKVDESQRNKLMWALEQGVAYAAAYYRKRSASAAEKQQLAIETAKSLAPKAVAKTDAEKLPVLVDAVYAKMKASLPSPSFHLDRGADIPVDIVSAPTPLPPPSKVPKPS